MARGRTSASLGEAGSGNLIACFEGKDFYTTGIIEIAKSGFWAERAFPRDSLERSAALFDEMNGTTIVEIGTGIYGEKSGNSVLVWAELTSAERIVCVDTNSEQLAAVEKALKDNPTVVTVESDGVAFLEGFVGQIDLLYLDFWVPDRPGQVRGEGRAERYLEAYGAARDKLPTPSLILIDDTDHVEPWKQSKILPAAIQDGYTVKWAGRQTLLVR